jgi:hypothetical protein
MRRLRRALAYRPLAILIAVWLPLFIGEPNLVSPCPTHGALAVMHAGVHSAHSGHHASMASHAAGGSKQSAPEHSEKDCSCIGCCTRGVARVAVVEPPVAIVAVAAYEPAPAFPPAETKSLPAPELSRPYPTGPPRA